MKEKDFSLCLLYDIYYPLFSEKKRTVFELCYNEDLSLSEISFHTGITRQGVRDTLLRTGEELKDYEQKLGLYRKSLERQRTDAEICTLAEPFSHGCDEFAAAARKIISLAGGGGE